MKRPRKDREHAEPIIVGGYELPDENAAYERAVKSWRKIERLQEKRAAQRIEFGESPVCIAFVADLHLGSPGVDYERVFREAKLIAETPGMYLMLDGDLLDNFIIPKLIAARYRSETTIEDEWVLVRKYLKLIGHKLLVSVAGNHEKWTWVLAGVDYFADVLQQTIPRAIIYDADDVTLTLRVGRAEFPLRLRHKWRLFSQYNATHGIEQASRFDGGFLVGVGAHTHASGVVRTFNAGGRNAIAVLCGSYKVMDMYARQQGFPKANQSAAMSILFFDNGAMVGIDRLELAAEMIQRWNSANLRHRARGGAA